jgi:endonuclease/exonuclease/phosphatase family metal-dependent hydrolase
LARSSKRQIVKTARTTLAGLKLKTLQWNIGAALTRAPDADPKSESSYTVSNLEHVIAVIKANNPDVVTLQEVHKNNTSDQGERIAHALGWSSFYTDIYDQSHLQKEYGLAQSVLSRFPMSQHSFDLFYNPRLKVTRPNGEEWISHNKGLTTCVIDAGGVSVTIATLHLMPFRKFGVSVKDPRVKKLIDDVSRMIDPLTSPLIVQGDFNINNESLKFVLGEVVEKRDEVLTKEPTTPKGRRYDHVVFSGVGHSMSKVVGDVYTDHYPIYSEFELKA